MKHLIVIPSYEAKRKSVKKRLTFLYLLWLLGFLVSNVLWGLWVILVFLWKEENGRIVLGKREGWEELREEHVKWMRRSALAFVVFLPCFFALSAFFFKALIWIPYSWFFYRCFVGFVCLLFNKKPFRLLSLRIKKRAVKRSSDGLVVFWPVHFLK